MKEITSIPPDTDYENKLYIEERNKSLKDMPPKVPYSQPLAELILSKIYEGKRLSKIAKMDGIPDLQTIYKWMAQNPDFLDAYNAANKIKGLYAFDQIEEIAEEAKHVSKDEVPGLKLSLDAYKFIAERSDRERYGQTQNQKGHGGVTINVTTGITPDIYKDTRTVEELLRDVVEIEQISPDNPPDYTEQDTTSDE